MKKLVLLLFTTIFFVCVTNAQTHHKVEVKVSDINISENMITGKIVCQMTLETSFLEKVEGVWKKKNFWYYESLDPEDCSSFWIRAKRGDRNDGVISVFKGEHSEMKLLEVQLYGRTILSASTDVKPPTK